MSRWQAAADETVGCALHLRGLWEEEMGVVAIDWVRGRFTVEMELLGDGLNVQSGLHKRTPQKQ